MRGDGRRGEVRGTRADVILSRVMTMILVMKKSMLPTTMMTTTMMMIMMIGMMMIHCWRGESSASLLGKSGSHPAHTGSRRWGDCANEEIEGETRGLR
jgi:uncharacterized membrane protein (DUF4010 family)